MEYADLAEYVDNTEFNAVPIVMQRTCSAFTPEPILAAQRSAGQPAFMLHGTPDAQASRYTYLVIDCRTRYELNACTLTTITNNVARAERVADPAAALQAVLAATKIPTIPGLPPFVGGLAGYFAYEYAQVVHKQLHLTPAAAAGLPDVLLLAATTVLTFDAQTQTVTLSAIMDKTHLSPASFAARQSELQQQLDNLLQTMRAGVVPDTFALTSALTPDFNPEEFAERVEKAQAHIHAGDIFQLILANPQRAQMRGSLLAATQRVLAANPTPYQFYLGRGDCEVLGASPELLVAKHGRTLQTFPLAGTRRRGQTPAEDEALAAELTHSDKELSEHNMLIDLGRNDLGAVSELGSVAVTSTRQLLYFASVMHMGSTVTSRIDDHATALDIVAALMPAGTLAGAPKLRAMEIISELEQARRGVYGGTIGYLGFDGNLELAIGIRLAQREGDELALHAGAGIVADSVARHEYQEFNNKIRGVKNALMQVNEG